LIIIFYVEKTSKAT